MSFRFDKGEKIIMGILNCTPDSFSDRGKYFEAEDAIRHGEQLITDGADILDIGGESTRPGYTPVSIQEELLRVKEVVKYFAGKIPVSIDTSKLEVVQFSLDAGAQIVNDVSGLKDRRICRLIREYNATAIIMLNSRGKPFSNLDNAFGLANSVVAYAKQRLKILEIVTQVNDSLPYTWIDPGFGFGKSPAENYILLENLQNLISDTASPILVGTSGKSFYDGEKKLDNATLTRMAADNGAQIFRVHNVAETKKILEEYI